MTNPTQSATDAELVREAREAAVRSRGCRRVGFTVEAMMDTALLLEQLADRIEALSAEVTELELTAETARAQAKSALMLLEPLRASRRERDRRVYWMGIVAGRDLGLRAAPFEFDTKERMHADLDALEEPK